MRLKSIELSGFKSFAKKSGFEFNVPISAVVGPNGSGKSNVAEAFRFVLGEQSVKNMRGKKGEDLIWNGSNTEPRSSRAEVKIVFDNSDRFFNLDFKELVLSRSVSRDGLGEYSINGTQVRLKDVVELLASAGIGASGHHIISQGEADRIVGASPKERRAMIEEALGLRLYQYRRAESEKKLLKTKENIDRVEALRREIAPHLKFLKKQVEKVAKTEVLREELRALALEYFKNEQFYLDKSREALKLEREPLLAKKRDLSQELAEARAVLKSEAEGEHRSYAVLEIENKISTSRERKEGLSRELGRIEGLILAEERNLEREKKLALSAESRMVKLSELETLVQEIEAEREDEGLFARIKRKLREFIESRGKALEEARMREAEESLQKFRQEKSAIEADLKEVLESEQELVSEYEKLKKDLEERKDSGREAEKAVFRIMSLENEIVSALNMLKLREEKLDLEEAELEREVLEVSHLVGERVEVNSGQSSATDPLSSQVRQAQEERKRELGRLKIRVEDSGLAGAEEIHKEYTEVSERDSFLEKELQDLSESSKSLRALIAELDLRLEKEFATGLTKINREFNELFKMMFDGGSASLELVKEKSRRAGGEEVDAELPNTNLGSELELEEGLEIKLSLPRKKVKSLLMLSGGERALTSIALVFAISQVNPPPFIVLDETDAALDEANSRKYGDLIEKLARHSQLILITHNRETMSRAGKIYGVTMGSNGVSKLLSISFEEASEVAK